MLDDLKALGVQPIGAFACLALMTKVVLHLLQLVEQVDLVVDGAQSFLPARLLQLLGVLVLLDCADEAGAVVLLEVVGVALVDPAAVEGVLVGEAGLVDPAPLRVQQNGLL